MSTSSLARELRRHPRAVAAVVALSVAVGLLGTFRVTSDGLESRRQEVGYARAAAVVDTTRSQAVDAKSNGSTITVLADRAVVLADLMTRSPMREEIAQRAGVPLEQFLVQRPMNGREQRLTIPEVSRAKVGEGDRDAFILHVGVNPLVEGASPIIGIDVRAPDADRAARLADAAVAELQAEVAQRTIALSPKRRVNVTALEPATRGTAIVGPAPALAIFAALVTLVLGCGVTLLAGRLQLRPRRRRVAV
jgi:hypothetical protein